MILGRTIQKSASALAMLVFFILVRGRVRVRVS